MTPNLTAFTGVDSQNLRDVMVSVQFILAIGEFFKKEKKTGKTSGEKRIKTRKKREDKINEIS
ncbi:hypothetical protein [Lactobacillus delbrueckii]|uniref:hypothetical protein n=1 Tax=Lactobacillus delbrueckii TaxID=1584 RepID=UPI0022EBEDE0|nr:hypothetical protein [Lactobacillus delbrueckii]MDA3784888.1 hypothetical protein [Lactobacillus delbrueckii]